MKPTTLNLQFKNKNAVLREVELTILEYEMLLQALRCMSSQARKIYDNLKETPFSQFTNEYSDFISQIQEVYDKLEI